MIFELTQQDINAIAGGIGAYEDKQPGLPSRILHGTAEFYI